MNHEEEMLYFKMQLLQAEIAMNGMIAENKQREIEGKSDRCFDRVWWRNQKALAADAGKGE